MAPATMVATVDRIGRRRWLLAVTGGWRDREQKFTLREPLLQRSAIPKEIVVALIGATAIVQSNVLS